MLSLFRLLSHLPLRLLHGMGAAIGWVVFWLSPTTYRRRFREFAAQAGYGFGEVRPAVGHIGRMVGELPRLWLGSMPPIEWDNAESVDRAYAQGRGVLFLTHLGCFEITAQGLADRYLAAHGPLTVLYRPARKAWIAPLVAASRNRPGLEAVPTTLAGVRQMIKALRQGRAVGLLPDQAPPQGLGQWAPFFGREAYTMTLAARLALQTGCEVRLVWGERLPAGRGYRVHCRQLQAPLPDTLDEAVVRINAEMERLIRECPQQYLWSYARYKQPRAEQGPAKEAEPS